jgi:hypothetical protein
VELELAGESNLARLPIGALDLAREEELGQDGLERNPLLQHDTHEGAVDVRERGRENPLDP